MRADVDWEGTERMRTTCNGSVAGSFTSLAFGDAQTTASSSDLDQYHFAQLDSDSESDTDHAQFRQYSSTEGRWMSPDPYAGSYDLSNPQSMNRYTYVQNSPLSYVDPSGLILCEDENGNVYDTGLTSSDCGPGGTPVVYQTGSGGNPPPSGSFYDVGVTETFYLGGGGVAYGPGASGGGGSNGGSNAKQVAACRADVAINWALGFIPGYNGAKLAFTLAGGSVNFVQNYMSGKSIVTFNNPLNGRAGAFWALNGAVSTYNAVMQAAKTVGPGAVLDDVADAASTAGTVANLANTASAINDAIACGSVHN